MIMPKEFLPIEAMTDTVSELVNQFLDMANSLARSSTESTDRQASLMYELDSLISNYLDENQLSTDDYAALEQQVLNSLAEQIILEGDEAKEIDLGADDNGNFAAESVFSALEMDLDPAYFADNSTIQMNGGEEQGY